MYNHIVYLILYIVNYLTFYSGNIGYIVYYMYMVIVHYTVYNVYSNCEMQFHVKNNNKPKVIHVFSFSIILHYIT